jgi:predicted amidohydrolase YtcJ
MIIARLQRRVRRQPVLIRVRRGTAMLALLSAAAAGLAGVGCSGPRPEAAPAHPPALMADLVLEGGEIWTGPDGDGRASALAIAGGRILAAGGPAEIAPLIGPATRRLLLDGRTVWPGLSDAHIHLLALGRTFRQLSLHGARSPAEVAARVRRRAEHDAAPWILGLGWNENLWQPPSFPARGVLDAAVPDRPVWLRRSDGHAGWANREALRRAGVTRSTPDPPGGQILRDAAGEPTGVLVDAAAHLVERIVPLPTDDEVAIDLLRAARVCVSLGLTSVHDMGMTERIAAVFRRLDAAGRLPLRVHAYYWGRDATRLLDGRRPVRPAPGRRFTVQGLKLFADGAIGSRGAWLLAPYADRPGFPGTPTMAPVYLHAVTRAALRSGWQVATHAIGDAAVRRVLDTYARALAEVPSPDARLRIEHAAMIASSDLPRFRQHGVIASIQPIHDTLLPLIGFERALGPERARQVAPWRALVDSGAVVVFGRDTPIDRLSPLGGIWRAVHRSDGGDGRNRLTFKEAFRAYTSAPAHAVFTEKELGSIQPGFRADLTILDGRAEAANLHRLAVWRTLVDGRIEYQRPEHLSGATATAAAPSPGDDEGAAVGRPLAAGAGVVVRHHRP